MKTREIEFEIEYKEKQVKVTVASEENMSNAFLLKKSGNILTLHPENNQMIFKVWDIHSKKSILTYAVNASDNMSMTRCFLPEGPLLSIIKMK